MTPQHVLEWARRPGPRTVLDEVRRRVEQGSCGPRAVIAVELGEGLRRDVGQMLGVRWQLSDAPVTVGSLRAALAEHSVELEDLLVDLGGPLRNVQFERAEQQRLMQADRAEGRRLLHALDAQVPPDVVERCLVGAEQWTERAAEVVRVVRALGGEPQRLPVVAARLCGDAHALDASRPLGRAVARYLAGAASIETSRDAGDGEGSHEWQDPVSHTALWRHAWSTRGVVCDEVSTQVLVLNLPLEGDAAAVRLTSLPGEPVWVTLRSLRGEWRAAREVTDVYVCENPSVVEAAADRLGAHTQPLVCTYGQPSLAAYQLLEGLAQRATLRVRADGDSTGHGIVDGLLTVPRARRWRMPPHTSAYEEEIIEDLLADLAAASPRTTPVPGRRHVG